MIIHSEEAYSANFKRLVDFMSEHELNGLVIWGFLRDTHGGVNAALELSEYADSMGVRIIPGVGVNSYGGFWYTGDHEFSLDDWLGKHPELRAIGKDGKPVYWSWPEGIDPSVHTNACPSKAETKEWYLSGIEWLFETFPIGGIFFETGDIGTLCFCQDCLKEAHHRGDEEGNVSFADMQRTLPPLVERAHRTKPDAWIIYATYRLWDIESAKLSSGFGRTIPEYALADWSYAHDPRDILIDNIDALKVFREGIRPPTKHNLIYASYGGHYPAFGMDGKPHYKQISRLCRKCSEMGIEGLTVYGEVSDSFDDSNQKRYSEINYLALQEFSNDPEMSVEEFEDRHRDRLPT